MQIHIFLFVLKAASKYSICQLKPDKAGRAQYIPNMRNQEATGGCWDWKHILYAVYNSHFPKCIGDGIDQTPFTKCDSI